MLIQNYGLFWRLDHVYWGRPNNPGTLLGRYRRARRREPVNFANQKGIYVLYDEGFRIVYVGQSGAGDHGLLRRLRSHRRDHLAERWSRFSWFGLLPVRNGEINERYVIKQPNITTTLNQIEGILLSVSEPPLNLQRGRFGDNIEQYLQAKAGADADADNGDEE